MMGYILTFLVGAIAGVILMCILVVGKEEEKADE